MPEQLVVRRSDDPVNPIARESKLPLATACAVREARQTPGVIVPDPPAWLPLEATA